MIKRGFVCGLRLPSAWRSGGGKSATNGVTTIGEALLVEPLEGVVAGLGRYVPFSAMTTRPFAGAVKGPEVAGPATPCARPTAKLAAQALVLLGLGPKFALTGAAVLEEILPVLGELPYVLFTAGEGGRRKLAGE